MKKKKILFLGIVILFFTLVNFNYSFKNNNFNLLSMKAKAAEVPIMNLDIKDGQTYVTNNVEIKGWALNSSGVKAVDLYVVQVDNNVKVFNDTTVLYTLDLNTASGDYDGPVGTHTDVGQYKCDFACLKGYLSPLPTPAR